MSMLHPQESSDIAPMALIDTEPDRRNASRHVAVMLNAKMAVDGVEGLCRIRNISTNGAKLETRLPTKPGQKIAIELRSDLLATGTVRWLNAPFLGIEFDRCLDLEKFLKRPERRIEKIHPRAPRYQCDFSAVIRTGSANRQCRLLDISLSGAKFSGLPHIRSGEAVTMQVKGLPTRQSTVMWVKAQEVGLRFRSGLQYADLEQWLFDTAGGQAENE
jgi:hypothetical protein